MKVILCEDIDKVGLAGDVKNVSEGYARNFLLPKKLALPATEANLRKWESEKKVREIKRTKDLETARSVAAQLESVMVQVAVHAGREGHLFGAVTSQMIASALLEKGFSMDKKNIVLDAPIKALGEYTVSVRLHPQVTSSFKVNVVSGEPQQTVSSIPQ